MSLNSLFAQTKAEDKLSKKKLIEQADYYFFKENFDMALELYDIILDNYPKNHYVQYHRYVAYLLTDGRGSSLNALKEYQINEGKTDKFYNYWLGRIHHGRYEFEIAQEYFQAFLDLDVYKTQEIQNEGQERLANSIRANEFYLNPTDFEIVQLKAPVNSKYADLSPSFFSSHDELLFVSTRPKLSTDSKSNGYLIFHTMKEGSKWSTPTNLSNLGSLTSKNAKIEVVNNDGKLFFYQLVGTKERLLFSEPSLSSSTGWTQPKEFDTQLNNSKIASHFYINDDETVIYFSIKAITNGTDIYQTKFNKSTREWSNPETIPGQVNSRYNEGSPFLSHDGQTLYFSSNNPESIGKLDIFKSKWNESLQEWGSPVNLGFPTNTIDNEVNFQLNEDNISGFLSSDRLHGKGDFDIYYFHKQGKVQFEGVVYNKSTNQPVPNARIDMHPINYPDETFRAYTKENGVFQEEVFTEEEFKIEISFGNHMVYSERVSTEHSEHHKSFKKDFYIDVPDHINTDHYVANDYVALYDKSSDKQYEEIGMLGSKFRAGKKAFLNNVYFDIQSAHIKKESIPVLNELLSMLNNSPKLIIEIGGHTDNTGSYDTNTKLSLARANSVKNYLTQKGINSNRVKTKGYGPSEPIASNDDEENGRELNRRIEIIVL